MKEAIREQARQLGFEDCRFTSAAPPDSAPHFKNWLAAGRHGEMQYLQRNAQKRMDPGEVLPDARTIISVAASYGPPAQGAVSVDPVATARGIGVIAAYARFRDYHDVIGAGLAELTDFIQGLEPTSHSLWYVDTGPLLERDLAQRAGLGFIGKHTNLISRRLGNWFFIGEIITTLELPPDPPEVNRCGKCSRCISACPTGAITAPFQLDSRRCISYLTIELKGSIPVEFRAAIGNRIYGCDDCLAACPWNRFAREGAMMKPHAREDLAEPDLVELLDMDEREFKRRFAGTPMLRAKRRGFIRNVCVALGNVGMPSALAELEKVAQDPDPLIQEHARWAMEAIQSRSKKEAASARPDYLPSDL